MNRLASAITALSLATSACSGVQEGRQQPENACEASTQRLDVTLSTLEEKVTRAEELQRETATHTITLELALTKDSIKKIAGTLFEQDTTMQHTCRNKTYAFENLTGASEFSIRVASIRGRLQKLGIND